MRPYAVLAALGAACSIPQPAAPAFEATVEGGLHVRHAEALVLVAEPAGVTEPINVYLGNLHAHSKLSDGNPSISPWRAFEIARDEGDMDFMALSEHILLIRPRLPRR